MLIVMREDAREEEIEAVLARVREVASPRVIRGSELAVIVALGERERVADLGLEGLPGVDHVAPILKPYKLSAAELHRGGRSVVEVAGRRIGGSHFALLAAGDGVAAGEGTAGLPVITELADVREVERAAELADVVRVGAGGMQNYTLLTELGRVDVPVILERGPASTLEELLMAAEYVLKEGNERLMLCERGIRTFEPAYRLTLDVLAVPTLQELTHLPVLVDPSDAAGDEHGLLLPLSLAAAAAGADGIVVDPRCSPAFEDDADRIVRMAELAGKLASA